MRGVTRTSHPCLRRDHYVHARNRIFRLLCMCGLAGEGRHRRRSDRDATIVPHAITAEPTPLHVDGTSRTRVAVAVTMLGGADGFYWAHTHAYELGSLPDWADAYAASAADDPGGDENAITDQMIIDGVTLITARDEQKSPAE